MSQSHTSAPPDLAELGRKALIHAALAIEQEDAAAAERWLKVARSAGVDPAGSGGPEAKGETITERRSSRDRLMAVLTRRFERINRAMAEDEAGADGAPRLPGAGQP